MAPFQGSVGPSVQQAATRTGRAIALIQHLAWISSKPQLKWVTHLLDVLLMRHLLKPWRVGARKASSSFESGLLEFHFQPHLASDAAKGPMVLVLVLPRRCGLQPPTHGAP